MYRPRYEPPSSDRVSPSHDGPRPHPTPTAQGERPELLSIVIPAFNEEKRIEKTIETIVAYMRARRGRYEMVVSDDGSMDATRDIVTRSQQKALPIRSCGTASTPQPPRRRNLPARA